MTRGRRFNHDWLFKHVCRKLPGDYEGYGNTPRERVDMYGSDCSCGCKWAWWLPPPADMDWCICLNGLSHRCGMLTFEHQGCWQFEAGAEPKMREHTMAEIRALGRKFERRLKRGGE